MNTPVKRVDPLEAIRARIAATATTPEKRRESFAKALSDIASACIEACVLLTEMVRNGD